MSREETGLAVEEVARILAVTEETVHRWIREGTLASHRVDGEIRCDKAEVHQWQSRPSSAAGSRRKLSHEAAGLWGALELGGIHYDVAGTNVEEVLHAVARLPGAPSSAAPDEIARLLLEREQLAPTASDGVAIPHPRSCTLVPVNASVVMGCALSHPVDFHACDGKPATIVFAVFSRDLELHLRVLSRIAVALRDPLFRAMLDQRAAPGEVLDRVWSLEYGERRRKRERGDGTAP